MPARRSCRTYRRAAVRTPVLRETRSAEEEPMHRWPHPIEEPEPASDGGSRVLAADVEAAPAEDTPEIMDRVVEQFELQNRLLMDLLAAVNGLTAAVLARTGKG